MGCSLFACKLCSDRGVLGKEFAKGSGSHRCRKTEIMKNQIPRCKPNKRCERPLQGKLYTSEERD
jgi:hypothetical protein